MSLFRSHKYDITLLNIFPLVLENQNPLTLSNENFVFPQMTVVRGMSSGVNFKQTHDKVLGTLLFSNQPANPYFGCTFFHNIFWSYIPVVCFIQAHLRNDLPHPHPPPSVGCIPITLLVGRRISFPPAARQVCLCPKKQSPSLGRFKMVWCPPEADQWKYCFVSINHFEMATATE
jgi:hypothetical protein